MPFTKEEISKLLDTAELLIEEGKEKEALVLANSLTYDISDIKYVSVTKATTVAAIIGAVVGISVAPTLFIIPASIAAYLSNKTANMIEDKSFDELLGRIALIKYNVNRKEILRRSCG
jgi:4-hydroxybenzoate polyprenyltransferase